MARSKAPQKGVFDFYNPHNPCYTPKVTEPFTTMKEKLRKLVTDLELSISFPPCEMLDRQIDDFFKGVKDLDPDIAVLDENKSDDGFIMHRRILFHSPEQGVSIDVTVVQILHPEILASPLYIINADYDYEE